MGVHQFSPEEYSENLNKFFVTFSQIYKNKDETYKKELRHFFEIITTPYKILKEVEDEFNYRFAVKFNLMEIFKPDEPKISGIIAELLNPKGTHGQKNIFLECFIDQIKKELQILQDKIPQQHTKWLEENVDWENVSVATEMDIKNGRIDIVINLSEFKVIAIENKPWAGEQEDQLQRYVDYLEKETENYLLIFLTNEGKMPESLDTKQREKLEKAGKFVILSYNKFLKNWLKNCVKLCEAEKVRIFLKDFIAWIEKYFPENMNFS